MCHIQIKKDDTVRSTNGGNKKYTQYFVNSGPPLNSVIQAHGNSLYFWNGFKMHSTIKQVAYIKFLELETSHENQIIQNESVYVHTKYHSNKSLFT
jgi:hypothetical protein